MILPQFLFFFQALPVEIYHKTFLRWQRILTSFVSATSRPRVGFSHLTRPASLGGFGFPDLEVYYTAAQLRPIYSFLRAKVPPGWIHIEESYVKPSYLKDVIWNERRDRPDSVCANPFLLLTLGVWDRSSGVLAPALSPLSSFLGQSWFPPARTPIPLGSGGVTRFLACVISLPMEFYSLKPLWKKDMNSPFRGSSTPNCILCSIVRRPL